MGFARIFVEASGTPGGSFSISHKVLSTDSALTAGVCNTRQHKAIPV